MQRHDVYEVLPIEYCYGAIQVKSKLTKPELKERIQQHRLFQATKANARQPPRSDFWQ